MALPNRIRLLAPVFSLALLVSSAGAWGGGGKGGGRGGNDGGGHGGGHDGGHGGGKAGGGVGQGALWGAFVGGVASMLNGGSFKEGAKAGAAAAGDPGRSNDTKQAVAAGKNAAEQSRSGSHSNGGAFDRRDGDGRDDDGRDDGSDNGGHHHGKKPKGSDSHGGPDQTAVTVDGRPSHADLTAAQAAALAGSVQAVALPPAVVQGSDGNPAADDDAAVTQEQIDEHLRKEGKGQFANPGSGRPAPPSQLASLDIPKRYQVNVPPVPPGVEVKGGQATADAQTAQLKLNGDAVASAFGTTVDLQAIRAPASSVHPEGARRLSGDVGGGRIDPRDRERALRATLTAGQSQFGLKNYNGALAEAEAAIELAPRNPAGYLLYAKTLNKLGLHAKAEEMARKARKLSVSAEDQALAQSELTQALLYQGRVNDAVASAAETVNLAKLAGNRGLEANGLFLQAAACQLKGDRACMVKSLERAAYLDTKYYTALEAAKAGKNVFDPNDKESLGLLDSVGGDDIPLPQGLGALGGGILAVIAALAGAAGLAWRRSRQEAAKAAVAAAFGGKKDDGLLGGKYALGAPVALEGGGEAWEASDRSLGRRALVVRLATPAAAEEARRLASVHHPNVVDVFEVLDDSKGRFMVQERLSGRTLRQLLAARGKMGLGEARRLLAPVCEALEAARGHDVSASGLTLSSAMLCDEGYVKVTDLSANPSRGDVQALAACLAELLTGRPHRPDVPLAGAPHELSALLTEAAAGKVPGPAAFAARLERLSEAVLTG